MNGSLRISVITPVFNRGDVIGRCIESVLLQHCDCCEHIIVDDGSTDETADVVGVYARQYSRVVPITLASNSGVNVARNRGIEYARGDFILLLDSDDELLPDALSTVQEALERWPGYQHYLFVPSDLEAAFKRHRVLKERVHECVFEDWLSGNVGGDFVHVVKRELACANRFSENFRTFEVLDFLRMYKAAGKQLYVNRVVTKRERNRTDSVTREYYLDNRASQEIYYRYVHGLVNWFGAECPAMKSKFISNEARKGVLLGLALGVADENRVLLQFLDRHGEGRWWLKVLSLASASRILQVGIYLKSKLNQLIK